MKGSPVVALAALALSLGALALALDRPRLPAAREASPTAPADAGEASELRARVEALSEEARMLRERLEELERRPTPAPRAPVLDGLVTREELEALRDELRSAPQRRAVHQEGSQAEPLDLGRDPAFKEQVAEVLATLRHEEAVEKARDTQAARSERLDQDLARIEEWLQLSTHQSYALRTALLTQYEREAELVRRWAEEGSSEALGQQKRSDREAFQAELATFLTPEQLESFWARVAAKGR